MKTEDLKALGLNDEQVQRVFAMNGADVNREKQAAETAKAERDAIRTQLDEANTKLKGYDPDWQQKAADAQKAGLVPLQDLDRDIVPLQSQLGQAEGNGVIHRLASEFNRFQHIQFTPVYPDRRIPGPHSGWGHRRARGRTVCRPPWA